MCRLDYKTYKTYTDMQMMPSLTLTFHLWPRRQCIQMDCHVWWVWCW